MRDTSKGSGRWGRSNAIGLGNPPIRGAVLRTALTGQLLIERSGRPDYEGRGIFYGRRCNRACLLDGDASTRGRLLCRRCQVRDWDDGPCPAQAADGRHRLADLCDADLGPRHGRGAALALRRLRGAGGESEGHAHEGNHPKCTTQNSCHVLYPPAAPVATCTIKWRTRHNPTIRPYPSTVKRRAPTTGGYLHGPAVIGRR